MKNISLDLSGKISELTITILHNINRVATKLNLPFFVIGATSRDIILQLAHDIETARATVDIDIGVMVSGWDHFVKLKNELVKSKKFKPSRQMQRLEYDDNYPVDIIPFGAIEDNDNTISWPPDGANKMNMAGFQESYQHSISVKLQSSPELVVKVVSLEGLTILKLISWDDNIDRRIKDAADLLLIMGNYLDAGNTDRLFEEGLDLVEENGFDYEISSARFLGRNIAKISTKALKSKLVDILGSEAKAENGHRIAMDALISKSVPRLTYDQITKYFNSLLKGIVEIE
jgi:predicted nucleotidyltransferase